VINFFFFVAEEVRELLAQLGFRTLEEAVGRVDCLRFNVPKDHPKASRLDFSAILHQPAVGPDVPRRCVLKQDHGLEKALDNQLIGVALPALENKEPVELDLPIRNINRTVGTMLSYEVARRYGNAGLPDGTIKVRFTGSAGNSFGAFLAHGITFDLIGDANDYLGKGLSGGRIIVRPPAIPGFVPERNIIAGNVICYGATSGEVYLRGVVGERFCVRNSGAIAVVEGVGDHGCEYMTGGRVVVIGQTGRNFAAGMSGGIAYVHDQLGNFAELCNTEMVELERPDDDEDAATVRTLLENHAKYTGSTVAQGILDNWGSAYAQFVKVMPTDYRRVLAAQRAAGASAATSH
jgi:glutamate synthase domain-containing protein 3